MPIQGEFLSSSFLSLAGPHGSKKGNFESHGSSFILREDKGKPASANPKYEVLLQRINGMSYNSI
ncbi:MAG: hypothetical protein M3P08_06930, partial [Thermoproteota archaeon]|nr:hypothetical protein [Thermoproteota archaeon]